MATLTPADFKRAKRALSRLEAALRDVEAITSDTYAASMMFQFIARAHDGAMSWAAPGAYQREWTPKRRAQHDEFIALFQESYRKA